MEASFRLAVSSGEGVWQAAPGEVAVMSEG